MTTLLMRLTGPMQSWGTRSKFSDRDSGLEPSKSGVIGLICSALGRPRTAPVDDLVALRMGVRVDREGLLKSDYHTAADVPDPWGKGRRTVLSTRYYLADAEFLVGLEGEQDLLEEINEALARPRWQLFLGRKAFPPSAPIRLPDVEPWGPGIRSGKLEQELAHYPWLGGFDERQRQRNPPEKLRLVVDASAENRTEVRSDVPISFSERRFMTRFVCTSHIDPPPPREEEAE